jgi:hypothetical protein
LIAYLDDLRITDEVYLMRPFQESLRRRGPGIGLYFTKRAKNYIYVPLPFRDTVLNLYPDAVVVADDSPGDDPASQLKLAVEANALMAPENEGRMLITLCGVAKLMGSPLRLVEREPEAAAVSTTWLEERVEAATLKVARLFAHVGLHAVDEVATRGNRVPGYPQPDEVARLPTTEPQIQNFVARHTLARRLNHLARALPPSLVQRSLNLIDELLGATVAGLMRKRYADLPRPLQQRLVLPGRHSGSMPGGALAAPAQYLSSRAGVERLVAELSQRAAAEGRVTPPALQTARARENEREQEEVVLLASERGLVDCMERINVAAR